MDELGVLEGIVGFKEGGPNEDGGWVIRRTFRVDRAIQTVGQRGIVQGIVLRIAADADVRLGTNDLAQVIQEIFGEGVWTRVVPCKQSSISKMSVSEAVRFGDRPQGRRSYLQSRGS